jgi:hypothetical protein
LCWCYYILVAYSGKYPTAVSRKCVIHYHGAVPWNLHIHRNIKPTDSNDDVNVCTHAAHNIAIGVHLSYSQYAMGFTSLMPDHAAQMVHYNYQKHYEKGTSFYYVWFETLVLIVIRPGIYITQL